MSGGHVDEGRLRALVEKWRFEVNGQYGLTAMGSNADGYVAQCADELEALLAAPLSASEAQGVCNLCPTCGGCRKGHIHCRKCSCVVHSDAMPPEEKEAQRRSFAYGNTKLSNGAVTREMVNQEAENMPHVHDPRPMRYGMACAECGEILEAAAAPLSQAQSPAPRDAQGDEAIISEIGRQYWTRIVHKSAGYNVPNMNREDLEALVRAALRARASAPEGMEQIKAFSEIENYALHLASYAHTPENSG